MLKFVWHLSVAGIMLSPLAEAKNLIDFPLAKSVIDTLVDEHEFERAELVELFSRGEYIARNVQNLAKPAETTKSYREYRPMFISEQRLERGRKFMDEYAVWLNKAEQLTGVPGAVVAAIMGIETHFGGFLGQHKTFNALGTLAVTEGRRASYFQRELINFMLISRDQGFSPETVIGSYAGAMGYPQFMPSSYNAYAIDLDEDGDIDIWGDPIDAIGSVANYLSEHGWRAEEPIATRARVKDDFQSVKTNNFVRDQTLQMVRARGWEPVNAIDDPDAEVHPVRLDGEDGAEFWLGYRNFWVISRYNRSIIYTMAVFQLAQELDR